MFQVRQHLPILRDFLAGPCRQLAARVEFTARCVADEPPAIVAPNKCTGNQGLQVRRVRVGHFSHVICKVLPNGCADQRRGVAPSVCIGWLASVVGAIILTSEGYYFSAFEGQGNLRPTIH